MSKQFIGWALVVLGVCGCSGTTAPPETEASGELETAAANGPVLNEPVVMERVKAEAGVGERGRSLENETGVGKMIAEPAKALFSFEQKAVFDIQIPQAMQLFKAMQGRDPESHDEFMEKIVKANRLQLPKLPEGHKYVYDTDSSQLMVERPAAQ